MGWIYDGVIQKVIVQQYESTVKYFITQSSAMKNSVVRTKFRSLLRYCAYHNNCD